jgi:1-acyl-sn-glycerol-3-phosphate acyltransferase
MVQHDDFAERLRAFESEVGRALEESGGESSVPGFLGDGLEALLAGYARVAREVEAGAGWLPRVLGFGTRSEDADAGSDAVSGPTLDDDPVLGFLLRGLYHAWWRVEVTGLEHVPRTGRVLLVANHSGGLFPHDAAMLTVALEGHRTARRDARPLLDDFVCNLPLVAELARRIGGVRARPETAERLLADDQAVIAFPEGVAALGKPYAQRYRVRRFGRGAYVRAALRAGAVVVPVAIIGAEETHPVVGRWDWLGQRLGLPYFPLTPTFPWLGMLGLVPLPSKWRIEVGRPLPWSGRTDARAGNAAHVARRNEDVRQQVQRLVVEALERRGHAFL